MPNPNLPADLVATLAPVAAMVESTGSCTILSRTAFDAASDRRAAVVVRETTTWSIRPWKSASNKLLRWCCARWISANRSRRMRTSRAAGITYMVDTQNLSGRDVKDDEVVRKINPNIVMCSISAFGQEGPLAAHPGFDYIAQAYAAVTDLIGEPDRAPSMPMLAFGDVGTGVHALTAIGYALLDRERNGAGGQWLDISLLDTYFHHHEVSVQAYSASGGKIVPHRSGAHHYAVGPSGIFKAREGHLMILALLHQWPILCRAMGREELIADPQFVDNDARMVNRTEMIAIIEAWLQTLPSDAAALELLEKARIPCAPILSVPQAMAHPHLIERRTVREIEDRLLGKFKIPGMPLRFSKYEVDEDIQAPLLGEHNEEILKQLLLCPPEQVRDWERRKVLFAKSV